MPRLRRRDLCGGSESDRRYCEVAPARRSSAATKADGSDDDELNKKKKGISLAQKVSRVTVLLPKKVSEKVGIGNPL